MNVLNLASGPCRDVSEFLWSSPDEVRFDCIEQDAKAIAHAASLCAPFSDRVTFRQGNALRFRPSGAYDLIWAAGLFDYLNDDLFQLMLRRLLPFLGPGGELVIGNFGLSRSHSNFHWLRLCEWILHHRTADKLRALATQAGASDDRIWIGMEPAGVNLFLHVCSTLPER